MISTIQGRQAGRRRWRGKASVQIKGAQGKVSEMPRRKGGL